MTPLEGFIAVITLLACSVVLLLIIRDHRKLRQRALEQSMKEAEEYRSRLWARKTAERMKSASDTEGNAS